MREIEFRGLTVTNPATWTYGLPFKGIVHNKISTCIQSKDGTEYEVDPESVGEYTGLKDKKGKKIYEGDVIEYTFDLPNSQIATENGLKKRFGEVNWCEWRSSFAVYGRKRLSNQDLFHYIRNGNTVEVIGTIYKNKDLLKE